jgi:hypothetical protein
MPESSVRLTQPCLSYSLQAAASCRRCAWCVECFAQDDSAGQCTKVVRHVRDVGRGVLTRAMLPLWIAALDENSSNVREAHTARVFKTPLSGSDIRALQWRIKANANSLRQKFGRKTLLRMRRIESSLVIHEEIEGNQIRRSNDHDESSMHHLYRYPAGRGGC